MQKLEIMLTEKQISYLKRLAEENLRPFDQILWILLADGIMCSTGERLNGYVEKTEEECSAKELKDLKEYKKTDKGRHPSYSWEEIRDMANSIEKLCLDVSLLKKEVA